MSESGIPTQDSSSLTLNGGMLALAIFVLASANFMAILDINIVNVAIPYIAGGLAVSPNEATWVITSYAVAEAIIVPLTGWLAARFGAVRVFITAVIGFGIVSFIAGFSLSMPMLVAMRLLQGMCGAPLMPISQTLLLRLSPPDKQGMAMGLWSMTTLAAPVIGPWLGGVLSDTWGWRWVFYINIPVAIMCALLAIRILRGKETEIVKNPIDYVGLILLIIWVSALQIVLDNGQKYDWFGSSFITTTAIISAVAFVSFIAWEITDKHPIVDIRIFRYRTFAVTIVVMFFGIGAFTSALLIIPLWLQTNMNYTATAAGEMAAFTGGLSVFGAAVAAGLMSRVDPRLLISVGLAMVGAAALYRIGFDQDITFWQLVPAQLAFGAGMPLVFVPVLALTVSVVAPEETASAAGLSNFIRTSATAFAVAIATTIWYDGATAAHAQLVDVLQRPDQILASLRARGFSSQQALQMLENAVSSQGFMLSTNRLFLMSSVIFFLGAAGIWLMPKPKGPLQMPTEAG